MRLLTPVEVRPFYDKQAWARRPDLITLTLTLTLTLTTGLGPTTRSQSGAASCLRTACCVSVGGFGARRRLLWRYAASTRTSTLGGASGIGRRARRWWSGPRRRRARSARALWTRSPCESRCDCLWGSVASRVLGNGVRVIYVVRRRGDSQLRPATCCCMLLFVVHYCCDCRIYYRHTL